MENENQIQEMDANNSVKNQTYQDEENQTKLTIIFTKTGDTINLKSNLDTKDKEITFTDLINGLLSVADHFVKVQKETYGKNNLFISEPTPLP